MSSPHDVTQLLKQWAEGENSALEALTPLVYGELRRLAAGYMRNEAPGHTLQPTALVHEAFLRLVGHTPECENRTQFYGVAARLMRQILVDHARGRQAAKRGGVAAHVTLEEGVMTFTSDHDAGLVALDDALEQLAALDVRKGRVVELRFFGGLSVEESAQVLGVSEVTIRRDWKFAKTWLLRELSGQKRDDTGASASD